MLLPVAQEARSELVGVHDSQGYEGALPGTTQARGCSSASVADTKSFRAPARIAQQAKQPADVEQARGNRSSDSQPNARALHLGLPHS